MEKLNLFFKYRTRDKFPVEILDALQEKRILNECIIESYVRDENYLATHKNISVFDPSYGWDVAYDQLIDWNSVPALSQDIMEKMLPYESMAIKLGIRRVNFPVTFYEDERANYLKHLRYWNYIFDSKKINAVYFITLPHSQHDYVIYALAMVKGIKVTVSAPSPLSGLYAYGTSIEDLGRNIEEYYKKITDIKTEDIILQGLVKNFYDIHSQTLEEIKKIENPGKDKKSIYMCKLLKKAFFGEYTGVKSVLKLQRMYLAMIASSILKHHSLKHMQVYIEPIWQIKNVNYFKRHLMISQKGYNKRAQTLDLSKKYIYFALQFFPEETIVPRAGVFSGQIESIQLLARCAGKYGIYVYVKEHPHQPLRDRRFFEELEKIHNVRLLKTTEATYDIMSHSIAVATQNGGCILEGVLMGKPAIVFSDGYIWHGLPGLFKMSNEENGLKIICEIINGYEINQDEVKKYFYAIQQNVIEYELEDRKDEGSTLYPHDLITMNIHLLEDLYSRINTEN